MRPEPLETVRAALEHARLVAMTREHRDVYVEALSLLGPGAAQGAEADELTCAHGVYHRADCPQCAAPPEPGQAERDAVFPSRLEGNAAASRAHQDAQRAKRYGGQHESYVASVEGRAPVQAQGRAEADALKAMRIAHAADWPAHLWDEKRRLGNAIAALEAPPAAREPGGAPDDAAERLLGMPEARVDALRDRLHAAIEAPHPDPVVARGGNVWEVAVEYLERAAPPPAADVARLVAALRACDRALSEAREMLGVFEDNGGHDGMLGKGYLATIDHMDGARTEARAALAPHAARTEEEKA